MSDVSTTPTVIVARYSSLGDVALALPLIYSACEAYPNVRFVFVTRPSMTAMFVNHPVNLVLVGADVKGEYKGIRGMWKLVGELCRQYRPVAFVDLHDVLRTRMMRIFFKLRGVPSSHVAKHRQERKALTRPDNKVRRQLPTASERYAETFFAAGYPVHDRFGGLYPNAAVAQAIVRDIAGEKSGEKWIGIAPFAAHDTKIYPLEDMHAVVRRLVATPNVRIFLFGGGGRERDILTSWATNDHVVCLAGRRLGFAVETALMSMLDVMVSMDSSNMHLASLVNTRVISIWGSTSPLCGFLGRGQSSNDVLQADMDCRPCSAFGQKPCIHGDLRCMRAISSDTIYQKIIAAINGPTV